MHFLYKCIPVINPEFSASLLQCHMMILQKTFEYADLMLNKYLVIINVENSCAAK